MAVPQALAPYASQVLSSLINAHVFYILPDCRLEPYNPRTLPREVYVADEELELDPMTSGPGPSVVGVIAWLQQLLGECEDLTPTASFMLSCGPTLLPICEPGRVYCEENHRHSLNRAFH